MVVQAPQHRYPSDDTICWNLLRNWYPLVVIKRLILLQNLPNLRPPDYQEIIQSLPSHSPYKSFHYAVHVRRFYRRSDRHKIIGQKIEVEHRGVVMNKIGFVGEGFAEEYHLLPDKLFHRTLGDSKLDLKPFFKDSVNRKEIHGVNGARLNLKEVLPG